MLWKLLIFVSTTKKCLKLGHRMCFEIYNGNQTPLKIVLKFD